ncbi:hypothetical protein MVEN_01780400 [Mycena venus]|uniref:Aminoglycoside phosphotransferase domain-containing protein n=1 Tax=Mycena venus TaxID=2733690 RepID=A0A8H6XNF9_9AGAR|nr:hypothetical protein MVEN_01780400 [Mycena venus]
MEFIEFDATIPPRNAPQKVADALQWLRGVPAPSNVVIGTVGGMCLPYRVFSDYEAPFLFSSKEALERYTNKAFEWVPLRTKPPPMEIIFIQSDMDESNFAVDKQGSVCIFDFEVVSLLPESFASFTLHAKRSPFIDAVAGYLQWAPCNLSSMGKAWQILNIIGDNTLGMSVFLSCASSLTR